MIDDDGSEMIEFPEFLGIIKMGGSKSKSSKNEGENDGLGAINQFFKDLTTDKMQIGENKNMPFGLFISSQRRRKII